MRGWWRLSIFAAITLALLWAMRTPAPPTPLHPVTNPLPVATDLGSEFSQVRCGTMTCRVVWDDAPPAVRPLSMFQAKTRPGGKMQLPNPNAPRIGKDGGLADAFICLRGVDLKKSRPWEDLPPVRVEVNASDMIVFAGDKPGRLGVVRRGESVDLVSREPAVHGIRGRGPGFFTQMLFVPDQAVSRRLSDSGIVELSSGSWYFWMRGYLAVSDHPYVGVTDTTGEVRFASVPEGEYDVVCWKANWKIAQIERDPEWIFQTGIVFEPPVEIRQRVRITSGRESQLQFNLNEGLFTASAGK